jgi:hypothetical protein
MLNIFRKKANKENKDSVQVEAVNKNADTLAEVAAVISYALHLYQQDIHDYENMILTIQKVVRPYSPWSSKIYGLRQIPRR